MKRLWKPRNNRRLQSSLVIDFLLFMLFVIVLFVALQGLISLGKAPTSLNDRKVVPELKVAARDYIADWQQGGGTELDGLFQSEGWIEILDEQRHVEQVVGDKKDTIFYYSQEGLYDLLGNSRDQGYYYSMSVVEDSEKIIRYIVVKIPRNLVSISVYDSQLAIQPPNPIPFYVLLFIASIILLVFGYSYWIARRIQKPLDSILQGLNEMIAGNYSKRLSISAEKEFMLIEERFNYMADVIETTTFEKRIAQESKQRLMMDLSHDLKTPITSIHGYAQALVEGRGEDRDRQKKYLTYIYKKSIQVAQLIQNMLELFKVDMPDFKPEVERREIGEFLRERLADVYGEVEQKDFLLNVSIPPHDVFAQYDPELLSRVIQNLISNALSYNPKGTHLRVELFDHEQDVSIEIADTGKGIPKELWTTIFDPFVRGDQARTHTGGTGLGLAIALKNTEKMGGTLTLRSEGSESSIFTIHLIH
ncbi:sensor histidine kinase [Paenibacillus kribbensis]|uniref:sensor histidine kinase n=1 Tax=Paenibacillus kribbensis TaxID=172713 RepID=UPI000838FF89|nr:HAMP domain-containing sensor histidine kinase [Paenibacillus kribbensis]